MAAPSAKRIFGGGGYLTVIAPCLREYSVFYSNLSKNFPCKFFSVYNNVDRYPNRYCHFQLKSKKCVTRSNIMRGLSHNRYMYTPMPLQTATLAQSYARRWMTTGLTSEMIRKKMEMITDRFMEAKELLDDARESMGSVYFNEDLRDADKAVEETLAEYKSLLCQLDDERKQNVISTIGLRMQELSAQQKMIRESLKD